MQKSGWFFHILCLHIRGPVRGWHFGGGYAGWEQLHLREERPFSRRVMNAQKPFYGLLKKSASHKGKLS